MRRLFTSESVTEGHPDKLCDRISDAVLDEILIQDPMARVACETCVNTGLVLVMGEISTTGYVDIEKTARKAIAETGYDSQRAGFDAYSCGIITSIKEQSADIALGVDHSFESKEGSADEFDLGAGDQGMMFGFACNETPELMPLPISMAHSLTQRLAYVRKNGILDFILPDGKSQVTVEYEDDTAKRIDAIVISAQHTGDVRLESLREAVTEEVIKKTVPAGLIDRNTKIFINPTGRFVIGGPQGDSGLTGRKIIVDTYGGAARHGGGAFSGKDPTKVDRSASYAARQVAKTIVAAGLAARSEVQIAYAIGVSTPVSISVNTFGTGIIPDEKICSLVEGNFDLRPQAIIKRLDLRRPIYKQISSYGHFGRTDIDLPWEHVEDYLPLFKR